MKIQDDEVIIEVDEGFEYAIKKTLRLFGHISTTVISWKPATTRKKKQIVYKIKFKNLSSAFKMGMYYGTIKNQLK